MGLLTEIAIFLGAAIVTVPVAKRLGFGSVLGYLIAGIVIGPSFFGLVPDVKEILHFSEIGVVFLLFVIGLELQPSRLWVLRKSVFGLGSAQVVLTGGALILAARYFGTSWPTAIIIGLGLSLSSTAFVLQMLAEKKATYQPIRARRFRRSVATRLSCDPHDSHGAFFGTTQRR